MGVRIVDANDLAQLPKPQAIPVAVPDEEIWIIAKPAPRDDAAQAQHEDDTPGSGAMLAMPPAPKDAQPRAAEDQPEPQQIPLPLKHTEVKARVDGYISTVDVTQQFHNPFAEKIEAVYVFPLPQDAAVNEFIMTIGPRKIRGIIREKQEAERIYHEARAQGYQAALLTQQRPNIFTQKVANIEPGNQIDVNIRYFHTLAYRDGWYTFVFPMVVGPRFNPSDWNDPITPTPRRGHLSAPVQRTHVPYLRPNERSAHDINITLDLLPGAGVPIEQIRCTSHAIQRHTLADGAMRITLSPHDTIPNKDLVVSFRVAGEQVRSNLLTHVDPQTNQGYFTFMLYPPAELGSLQRQPMEMVFVLDCSGSMAGTPMAQSKDAMRHALKHLQPQDTFQIIRFSDNASAFGPRPVPASPENIKKALKYVENLSGQGGTQMIEGIKAALDFPHDPERFRVVTFLTDGYIGNDTQIIGEVHNRVGAPGSARIFSFGVGSSVNRYLLERMAKEGRGAAAFLGPNDSGAEVMDLYFSRISHPAMTDLAIDFGGMRVSEVYPNPRNPRKLPDLFVGRPVIITGKFTGQPGTITVTGRAGTQELQLTTDVRDTASEHAALAQVWARRKIAELNSQLTHTPDPDHELVNAIKDTALAYSLMSNYTAFIAVDASHTTAPGSTPGSDHGTTVHQALPMPEGVRYDTTVAEQ